jgi:hypothetical protein
MHRYGEPWRRCCPEARRDLSGSSSALQVPVFTPVFTPKPAKACASGQTALRGPRNHKAPIHIAMETRKVLMHTSETTSWTKSVMAFSCFLYVHILF